MLQDYYNNIKSGKKLLIKLGIIYGIVLTTLYLIFRAYYINLNPYLAPFSILLYLAELHTIILLYGFFYSLWPRSYKVYDKENKNKNLKINLFVTVAGEPTEIVEETITHAKKAADYYENKVKPNYPPRVIVLNDGKAANKDNWNEVAQICQKLGVYHVARETNEGFKAGNINNGLRVFPSDDPHNTIDCFFDSDFCAKKEFLIEILKPINDDSVDFVQSPQRYKNLNTWVAQAAGSHQIFFFDYICPAKAYDNALFLCGTNYAIRREALMDAQGVENRFVTEDYATSIKLHLLGKKGVFISKVLAVGMAPMNLKEYFNQQTRWCKGCLDANRAYMKQLFFGHLSLRQKFHYFISTAYYFIGVRDAILVLAPLTYLFFGVTLIRANSIYYLAWVYVPLILYNFLLFFITFKNPVKSLVLDVVSFPVFAKAFMSSVVGHNLPFTITIKKYEKENPFKVYKTQLTIAIVLALGLFYSTYIKQNYNPYGRFINHFWAAYDAIFLFIGFWLVMRENYNLSWVEQKVRSGLESLSNSFDFSKRAAFTPAFGVFLLTSGIMTVGYGLVPGACGCSVAEEALAKAYYFGKNEELLIPGKGVYYGYYLPELDTHPENPAVSVSDNETPTLVMFYQDWNQASRFNKKFMDALSDKDVIPIVTWEPWDTQNNPNAPINNQNYPQKLIIEGYYDSFIRDWAKAAKEYQKPFFLRFAHEMNGNWYPWGNYTSESADLYKKMWIHVYNIFQEESANNVMWLWAPNNTDQYANSDTVLDYYPGDAYVDWTGFSAFNWGDGYYSRWMDFKTASWKVYEKLSQLNKPIMVAETSSASKGGDKTGWFYNTLTKDINSMPWIKAIVLFSKDSENADFSLKSGMDAEKVINDAIISNGYFLKDPILNYSD